MSLSSNLYQLERETIMEINMHMKIGKTEVKTIDPIEIEDDVLALAPDEDTRRKLIMFEIESYVDAMLNRLNEEQ